MHSPSPHQPPNGSRRRHPRRSPRGLSTPFGQVLDLSESGACVFRKGSSIVEPGEIITLQISDGETELHLRARVVQTQPLGLRRRIVGVAFIDLAEFERDSIRRLVSLASTDFSPTAWLAA